MFNAVTLRKLFTFAFIASCALVCSCSGDKTNNEAETLLSKINNEINTNNPEIAIALIDSLNKKFPAEVAIRKNALHLRTIAEGQIIEKEMKQVDEEISKDSIIYSQLKNDFKFIKDKDMVEGFHLHKSLNKDALFQTTGIQPRTDEQGNLLLISSVFGLNLKHTSIIVQSAAGQESTSEVPYDDSINYRYTIDGKNSEMITFHSDKCENFFKFISDNADKKLSIVFIGKNRYSMVLPQNLKLAIKATYEFSQATIGGKKATIKKMYLIKKLEINKKQQKSTEIQ